MGQLIDARTSSNIPVVLTEFDNTFPLDTPVIVGQVGLNIPPQTQGIIRVQLTGMVGVALPTDFPQGFILELYIVRGLTIDDVLIYKSVHSFDFGIHTIGFSASDYHIPAPASGLQPYTLFAIALSPGIARIGPENLNASAYTG
ncbi:hypothetical protein [Paenibacillus sp. CF384]|uniref:hypothetical protein n=1 Tax=Paenibacillus sp. CF384 TaxID=1884382 RepID=UPI0008951C3A|nr:hypothetical protein [Paenibacillus sp. CF384]SDW81325.1 hypothetical protein SAMN05518855_1005210 [Paenibacillus sp. CF384]